jgi:hypothetical protein
LSVYWKKKKKEKKSKMKIQMKKREHHVKGSLNKGIQEMNRKITGNKGV